MTTRNNDCDHNLLVWIDLEMSGLDLSKAYNCRNSDSNYGFST